MSEIDAVELAKRAPGDTFPAFDENAYKNQTYRLNAYHPDR